MLRKGKKRGEVTRMSRDMSGGTRVVDPIRSAVRETLLAVGMVEEGRMVPRRRIVRER